MPNRPKSCVCLSCILCELVIQDQETKNKSLINMFNHVMVAALPARMHRLSVMISITDGRGASSGKLEILDPDGTPVIRGTNPVTFHDPIVIIDLCYEFRDVLFHKPGRYSINFWLGDDLIVMRPFTITCRPAPQGSQGPQGPQGPQASPPPPPDTAT